MGNYSWNTNICYFETTSWYRHREKRLMTFSRDHISLSEVPKQFKTCCPLSGITIIKKTSLFCIWQCSIPRPIESWWNIRPRLISTISPFRGIIEEYSITFYQNIDNFLSKYEQLMVVKSFNEQTHTYCSEKTELTYVLIFFLLIFQIYFSQVVIFYPFSSMSTIFVF